MAFGFIGAASPETPHAIISTDGPGELDSPSQAPGVDLTGSIDEVNDFFWQGDEQLSRHVRVKPSPTAQFAASAYSMVSLSMLHLVLFLGESATGTVTISGTQAPPDLGLPLDSSSDSRALVSKGRVCSSIRPSSMEVNLRGAFGRRLMEGTWPLTIPPVQGA